MSSPLSVRVSKASAVLGINPDQITKALQEQGIDDSAAGLAIIDASTTEITDLVAILANVDESLKGKILKLKAAASILKDASCERPKQDAPISAMAPMPVTFVDALKEMRPIQQWNDQELLTKFSKDRDPDVEQELHQRSKGRHFIVLKQGKFDPGKEEIDIELSLDILKKARKMETPSMLPQGDKVLPIYRIIELNINDRITEICPICGESLFKGFCPKCQASFAGIGDDERAYVNLISAQENFRADSLSDRKAVIASASKGVEDLKMTWPSLAQKFDELKLIGNLPRLRVIATRPTSVSDPFFTHGDRSIVGHRSF